MTQPGRNVIMRLGNGAGPEVFSEIGRLDLRRLILNATPISFTSESSDGWREILAGVGLKQGRIEGFGKFLESPAEKALTTHFFALTTPNFEFVLPQWGTVSGPFLVSSLDFDARLEGEFRTRMIFESAGALTFAAA